MAIADQLTRFLSTLHTLLGWRTRLGGVLPEEVAAKEALMDCTGERQTPNVTEVRVYDDTKRRTMMKVFCTFQAGYNFTKCD